MRVAYWPGCVSRGFTPELHGSMGLVAERLGIELVELDRANCCGAGVIAEHNQELASSLPAIVKAIQRRKVTPGKALFGEKLEKRDLDAVQAIYRKVDDAEERFELNLYVVGADEEQPGEGEQSADAAGSQLPEERSPNQ